jgi:hypothetical protein
MGYVGQSCGAEVAGGVKQNFERTAQEYCNLTEESHPLPSGAGDTRLFFGSTAVWGLRAKDWNDAALPPYACVLYGPPEWQQYRQ